jgi:hypothetical protein
MARLKSHYRKFRDGGAVTADTPPAPPVAIVDVDRNDVASDDASRAFQLQIDALKESERIQRQRAAQATQAARAAQAPPALTLREAAFLKTHPDFLDNHDLAHQALVRAHQGGHVADSDEFHQAVGEHFKALRPSPPAVESSRLRLEQPDPDLPEPSERSLNYSAPVSRDVPSSHYPDRPGRITLSVEQLDMARRLGQSPVEYAKALLGMRERDKEHGR